MCKTTRIRLLFVCAAILLALGAASCSGQEAATPAPSQPTQEPTVAAEPPTEVTTEAEEDAAGEEKEIDLEAVDVCELLPVSEIEAVIGKLREGSPKATISIDREKGCQYIDDVQGQFFEITFYPLDQWGLVKHTLRQATPVEGVGDGAYLGTYSDSVELRVLAKDRAVVGVRVSDENQDTARALYQVALKYLPQ